MATIRRFRSVAWDLYARYCRAEIATRAAALAYHSLLSIVPLVGLIFWYLDSIRVTDQWMQLVKRFLLTQLNVESSAQFLETFEKLTTNVSGGSWGWVGLAIFLYTGWNLLNRFGESLDIILDTAPHPPESSLSWISLELRRLMVMLLLPITLTVSLVVTNWIRSDSLLRFLFNLKTVGPYFALPLAWITAAIAFFLVYLLVPRRPVPWPQALKAALIVTPVSELMRYGFGMYNHYAVSTHKIYGVLAVIPMFVLWVQLGWMIILLGALFVRFRSPAPVEPLTR